MAPMRSFLLLLLVCLADVVLSTGRHKSEHKKAETVRPFKRVYGDLIGGEKARESVSFTRPASTKSKSYVYTFYGEKVAKIAQVELINLAGETGVQTWFDQGG